MKPLFGSDFFTKDGREINMSECREIDEAPFPNGKEVDIPVRCEAWDAAFDQAMFKEQFIDEDGNVTSP